MYVYTPEGYDDNNNDYPLLVFGHGYGERGTNVDEILSAGIPLYIVAGDRPPGIIIACPQDDAGDYTANDWDDVYSYMLANYRIDVNRVGITGLSGGAFWARLVAQQRPDDICITMPIAGSLGSGWDYS